MVHLSCAVRRRGRLSVGILLASCIFLAALLGGVASGTADHRVLAHAAPATPTIPARLTCAALVQDGFSSNSNVPDFENIPGAPTRITSAKIISPTNGDPEYCDVGGYILDQIKFDLKLPTLTWQGRYLQLGCGGFCGSITPSSSTFGTTFPACDANLGGDFAIAATNDGHDGAGTDALWAGNDTQLRIDFGYRSAHLVAVASKVIIAAYYGSAPSQSYWVGCSDGGREGLMEAQRYPADFDGIVAGAPANLMSTDPLWLGYMVQANTDSSGNPILTAAKLAPLHDAVLKACDGNDGIPGDGLIGDPRDCHFDPASIECKGADQPTCLTPAQVAVVDKIYNGVIDDHGVRLDPRMVPRGSELSWAGWWIPLPASPSSLPGTAPTFVARAFGENVARWLSYPIGEGKPLEQVKFTPHEFFQVVQSAKYYEALNPDLRAFRDHGGKLMIYQGQTDTLVPPSQTLMYYAAIRDAMGGLKKTQRFARLFMIPGMGHCGAFGPSPSSSDMLQQMVAWVEQGQAPASILVSDHNAATNETRQRPIFPYPLIYNYVGPDPTTDPTGPDKPQNFVAAEPAAAHNDHINWLGNFLLRPRPPDHSS